MDTEQKQPQTIFATISAVNEKHRREIFLRWCKITGRDTSPTQKINQAFYYVASKPIQKLKLIELNNIAMAIGVDPELLLQDCKDGVLYRTDAAGDIVRLGILGKLGESEYAKTKIK